MALIELGPLISGIAGSTQGATFANTRHGLVLKAHQPPRGAVSKRALAIRNYYPVCIASWNNQSANMKNAWTRFADSHPITNRLGIQKRRSPLQWWLAKQLDRGPFFGHALTATPDYDLPDLWVEPSLITCASNVFRFDFEEVTITHIEARVCRTWSTTQPTKPPRPPRSLGLFYVEEAGDPADLSVALPETIGTIIDHEYLWFSMRVNSSIYFPCPWHHYIRQYHA